MQRYEFKGVGLRVRLVDPAVEGGVGIRVEHDSGAALIVASVYGESDGDGLHLKITGFDGTRFDFRVDTHWRRIVMKASMDTPIFGGHRTATADRVQEGREKAPLSTVRVTGNETTMPIDVDDTKLD